MIGRKAELERIAKTLKERKYTAEDLSYVYNQLMSTPEAIKFIESGAPDQAVMESLEESGEILDLEKKVMLGGGDVGEEEDPRLLKDGFREMMIDSAMQRRRFPNMMRDITTTKEEEKNDDVVRRTENAVGVVADGDDEVPTIDELWRSKKDIRPGAEEEEKFLRTMPSRSTKDQSAQAPTTHRSPPPTPPPPTPPPPPPPVTTTMKRTRPNRKKETKQSDGDDYDDAPDIAWREELITGAFDPNMWDTIP